MGWGGGASFRGFAPTLRVDPLDATISEASIGVSGIQIPRTIKRWGPEVARGQVSLFELMLAVAERRWAATAYPCWKLPFQPFRAEFQILL